MKKELPKILIISEFFFGEKTGGGILLKNLFEDYPKDKIFIVHEETNLKNDHEVKSFALKSNNRFSFFIKRILPGSFIQVLIRIKNFNLFNKRKKINPLLIKEIEKFKPRMIYTILGNYNLMCLIKDIKIKLNIPIMTHIMDNMPAMFSKKKPDESKLFNFFVNNSKTRVAINSKMADVFKKKYKYNFEIIHNGVDKKKIQKVKTNKNFKVLTYIGSVFKNAQLNSLVKIAKAVKSLNKKNNNLNCYFFFPESQKLMYYSHFPKSRNIFVKSHNLNDNEYFDVISKSDLLILASNFDHHSVEYYKYSWPAKMGTYLMSKVPIFIFGPKKIYFINNAIKKLWAFVDSSDSVNSLEISIEKILNNLDLRKKVLDNAIIMSKEFEIRKIKRKFINLIIETVRE